MTADELRHHLRYTVWATRRTLESVRGLSAAELDRDFGSSHRGVLGTLGHIYGADRIWLARVTGAPPLAMPDRTPPLEELEKEWAGVLEKWEYWGWSLTGEDPGRAIAYHDLKGRPWEHRLGDIVMHVVNHASYHRGQVAGMLRQLGHVPLSTDLILFVRERAAARS